MKEGKEQKQRTAVFDESDIIGTKIDNLTPMIGKLLSKAIKKFKLQVYQGKGRSLINPGRGDQYYNSKRNQFFDKGRLYDKITSYYMKNQTLKM